MGSNPIPVTNKKSRELLFAHDSFFARKEGRGKGKEVLTAISHSDKIVPITDELDEREE